MKKALLIVISIATLLLTSSCFYKVRPYKDLSEEDVSKLLRIHISSDMTHEEIFSKLESLGFEKFSDVHIDGLELWQDVIYYLGDVYVYVTLDITLNADVDNIIANGGINSYKSEYVTVNGVNNVLVKWSNRNDNNVEITESVSEQRQLLNEVESNIKKGDDIATAESSAVELGFTKDETYFGLGYKYNKDKYALVLITDNENLVCLIYFNYIDYIFKNVKVQE